jgi:hypothetical protein
MLVFLRPSVSRSAQFSLTGHSLYLVSFRSANSLNGSCRRRYLGKNPGGSSVGEANCVAR